MLIGQSSSPLCRTVTVRFWQVLHSFRSPRLDRYSVKSLLQLLGKVTPRQSAPVNRIENNGPAKTLSSSTIKRDFDRGWLDASPEERVLKGGETWFTHLKTGKRNPAHNLGLLSSSGKQVFFLVLFQNSAKLVCPSVTVGQSNATPPPRDRKPLSTYFQMYPVIYLFIYLHSLKKLLSWTIIPQMTWFCLPVHLYPTFPSMRSKLCTVCP